MFTGISGVKMVKYEPFKRENKNTDGKRPGKKAESSSGFLMATDEGIASSPGHAVNPSIDEHARLYADARSEKQRADLAANLQQHYGNNYMQRVAERYNNSISPAHRSIQSPTARLKTGVDNSSVCVNFKTIIRAKEGAEEPVLESQETPESKQETGELPGSKDSISPAYIGLAQQTSVGGSALTGTDHGSYTPVPTKNVEVKETGGVFSKDWEVDASLVINYFWSIQSMGKKDILNAYSDAVTPDKWPDIVTDLRPMGGGIPRSPRFNYWCSDLTAQHEMYHIQDCISAFKSFLPEQEAWLAAQPVQGKVSAKNLGYQALDQLITRVHNYMGEGNDAPQEERAYAAGASCYEERAQSVYDRAYLEGWMDEEEQDEYEDDELEPEEVEPEDEEEGDSWWDDLWEEEEGEEEETTDEEDEEEEEYGYEDGYEEEPYGEEEESENGYGEEYGYEGGYAEESYEEEEEDGGYSSGYESESSEEEYY
jgi:hypothetical protein